MKLGFFYSGQGSQFVGMGRDFYAREPAFRAVFDGAELDIDLKTVAFSDPEGVLNQTRYTQPCLTAFAAGVTDALAARGVVPACAAGLSLGEYAALYAAGTFGPAALLHTVNFRGKAMTAAASGTEFAMFAVLGVAAEEVEKACRRAAAFGVAEIAAYNCPGQMVIGGTWNAVSRAAEELGAARCRRLQTGGPFHTSLLRPAGDALRAYFAEHPLQEPKIPVLFNCVGGEKRPEDTVEGLLAQQVWRPVLLESSIRRMAELTDAVAAIGPGHAVAGFFRRTVPGFPCFSVETADDLDGLPEWLRLLEKQHG